ncbi:MAG TPA: prolipoprotein diacylglyceryl transferase [Phycisphaerae bacterium]|nr:prolipoprotein diacylglyceryl transferase [Phycisphaerae bacterium]HRW51252.1 prolipoprotein diacylglyceryl transferase [Phycisphaerae bacterium]
MLPTLFNIPMPEWLPGCIQQAGAIKSYGVMMMIAFLSGIWLACRRASRSQADPDIVLNLGFLALIFGVAGARLMFVLHYWDTKFANKASPLAEVFNLSNGGLEFWGGPLLVIPAGIIYLHFIAKVSTRWYLDICLPSLAWGLAITRVGCFLNGCCWGSVCIDQHAHADDLNTKIAAVPWAVTFPYGSPAMRQQYEFGQLTLPKELVYTWSSGETMPYPREFIELALEDNGETRKRLEELKKQHHEGIAQKAIEYKHSTIRGVEQHCEQYGLSIQQLADLANQYRSKPVHPSQLYAVINAFLISWILSTIFYYRQRHGVVLGWFLIMYSIARIALESIRADNPLDTFGGITISQSISLCTFIAGVLWLALMYRLPKFSPRAVPVVYEDENESAPPKAKPKNA